LEIQVEEVLLTLHRLVQTAPILEQEKVIEECLSSRILHVFLQVDEPNGLERVRMGMGMRGERMAVDKILVEHGLLRWSPHLPLLPPQGIRAQHHRHHRHHQRT
jgi:hypothetical protein